MKKPSSLRKYHILLTVRHPVGGIRTFLRYVYNHFDPSAYRFTLLLPETSEHKALVEDLEPIHPSYIVLPPRSTAFDFEKKLFYLLTTQKIDLVHSHGLATGALTALPAFLTRTPHIVTQHDMFTDGLVVGIKGYWLRKGLSFLLGFANVIHSVGHDAKANLIQYLPGLARKKDRIVVIPNGIDVERFDRAPRMDLRRHLGLSEGTFLIGFLGRFMSQKGFRYLVDAVEILAKDDALPKEMTVVTFGWGGFIREDMAMVKERGLDRYFRSMPFVSNIAPALKGLDVVAIPSIWEAGPILPLEAMVAGVPVIGTDCVGLREVLKDTPSVVVPAQDSLTLAEAIYAEMKNPSRFKAEKFREEAARRFDVRNQAVELEKTMLGLILRK